MAKNQLIIKSVKLENFRCHTKKQQKLDQMTTKILGPNGCGKTSILEAIYLVTRGKSFRAVDREIIKRGKNFYRVELEYSDGRTVVAFYTEEKKQFLIAGKKSLRLPKDMRYPVVLFEPKDLHIISSSPARRRSFFDRVFSQLNPEYSIYLSRYNKALQQRNKAFKDEFIQPDVVFPWNILLAEYGSKIQQIRQELIKQINQQITSVYQKVSGQKDQVRLEYINDGLSEDKYLRRLEKEFNRDRLLGCTNFGIHRDQFNVIFNSNNAEGSASRGESRSIMLALKFIEADLIIRNDGRRPIILLDDVFSELDDKHKKSLTQNFKDYQVILTSVK